MKCTIEILNKLAAIFPQIKMIDLIEMIELDGNIAK